MLMPIRRLHGDVTEFASKVRRALAFVAGSALSSIHTRQVTDDHSKVLCCQSVGSVAIFADQGGGVALLAAVVALPIGARYLADGGCEDHLDAACVVPNLVSGSR